MWERKHYFPHVLLRDVQCHTHVVSSTSSQYRLNGR